VRNQDKIGNQLKGLTSKDAANFLMEKFPVESPNYNEAFNVIAHRSWKKSDQLRLARFYFKKTPFVSSKPYEVFASFMSVPALISVVKEAILNKPSEEQFIIYHVAPVLKKIVKSEKDKNLVDNFVMDFESGKNNFNPVKINSVRIIEI
jgi:hypothetical protein